MPITQRGGLQTLDELGDRLRFETMKDFEDWIARLRAFPVLVDQDIALIREGARTHIMWPKIVLSRVPTQIDKQIVSKPEESPFFKPLKKFPGQIGVADRERLVKAAQDAIASSVLPSFQKLKHISSTNICPRRSIRSESGKCRRAPSSRLTSRARIPRRRSRRSRFTRKD